MIVFSMYAWKLIADKSETSLDPTVVCHRSEAYHMTQWKTVQMYQNVSVCEQRVSSVWGVCEQNASSVRGNCEQRASRVRWKSWFSRFSSRNGGPQFTSPLFRRQKLQKLSRTFHFLNHFLSFFPNAFFRFSKFKSRNSFSLLKKRFFALCNFTNSFPLF